MSQPIALPILELRQVSKAYAEKQILKGIELTVAAGEFVTVLGPSGAGKTTLLKIVAGFERPDSGRLVLRGHDMTALAPESRNIGIVFQNYSLFPNMTVAENIGFPLRMRGMSKDRRREAISEALKRVALNNFEERMPKALSGGQQQRVAIARAIVYEPSLLLMDEPLSALDGRLREQMQVEIKGLQLDLGISILYVTHDQDEALAMSDRLIIINEGRVEQVGMPREVYRNPATSFVADFLGDSLSFTAVVHDNAIELAATDSRVQLLTVPLRMGRFRLLWRSDQVKVGQEVDRVHLEGSSLHLPALILSATLGRGTMRLRVRLPTDDIGVILVDDTSGLTPGTRIAAILDLSIAAFISVSE